MLVVDVFDKGTHSHSSVDLLLAHGSSDLAGITRDACDEGVREFTALLGAIIVLLDDHCFLAGMAAFEHHHHSSWLDAEGE